GQPSAFTSAATEPPAAGRRSNVTWSLWWQAARCRGATGSSAGSSAPQSACAYGQRGWNGQPGGRSSRLGGLPGIEVISGRSPTTGGTAFNSPTVYGWRGR